MKNFLMQQLNISLPIIQAPMAGGIVTPAMISAVANAGGLASLPLGYLSIEEARKSIKAANEVANKKFSVNVFITSSTKTREFNHSVVKNMIAHINQYRSLLKLPNKDVVDIKPETDHEALIDLAVEEGVRIISFTFGTLSEEKISSLHKKGIFVMGTATSVKEGEFLERIGCDAVIAQGYEAGGHRGGDFIDGHAGGLVGTMALIPQMVSKIHIPVIAAGGIMTTQGIIAAQVLGAQAVQMGTAFLTCKESAASPLHKKRITESSDVDTCITRVFTGKQVRSIHNDFIQETEDAFSSEEILPYPMQHYLTKEMRSAASQQNMAEYASCWSGQASSLSTSLSVSELMLSFDQLIPKKDDFALQKLIDLEKQTRDFGFDWPDISTIIQQAQSECLEIEEVLSQQESSERLQEEIGDLLHTAISLCLFAGFSVEETLSKVIKKFGGRMDKVKALAAQKGLSTLKGESFEFMLTLWNEAKQ